MRIHLTHFLFALFFLAASAVDVPAQRGGGGNRNPRKGTIAGKQIAATLSDMEAQASEAEKKEDWEEASNSYRAATEAARISGQLQKAVSYGNKAFEMGEKARDPSLQAQAIRQLAQSLRQVGQQAKAQERLEKGIEIAKKIDAPARKQNIEADLYRELGVDFLRQGESAKAVNYISYSLQIRESQLAFVKRRGGASRAYRIQNNTDKVLTVLNLLGAAYERAGNGGEAIRAYEKGLVLIKESGIKTSEEAKIYQGLGYLFLQKKDFPRALENLQKALEVADRFQHASVIQLASSQIGEVLLQTQRPSEATAYYRKAIESVESTRSLLESEEFRSSFFEDKRTIYAGMILAHLRAGNIEEAFNYTERARSRAFLDILGSKVQLSRGTLLEDERALQARISVLQAKAGAEEEEEEGEEEESAPKVTQLRQDLEAAQRAYEEFLARVRKENREQASLMNVEPLTLRQVQELLEPEVTILEYFVVQGEVLLWLIETDQVRSVRAPIGRGDLVRKVTALRDTMYQVQQKEEFRQHAQELYRLLIEPALPHVRGKELLIVPHDVLHYLPFQALVSSQGKYLVQDYPIYYLSSASLMQFTREKRKAAKEKERALVMGNPALGDAAYSLRFAEREAKEVAQVYPKSAVYVETEATKARAISLSPKYDMLHFAVHAELNEQDPMSSALLLAPEGSSDGRLKVGEIFSLDLKTNMVVLSACETGLGKLSSGDELVGLTRAFIYAGTPSIVTTLWKVNDRASYELMREFYQHLKTTKKSEALRQAQLKTMEQFPQPFFWAAYELTGEP